MKNAGCYAHFLKHYKSKKWKWEYLRNVDILGRRHDTINVWKPMKILNKARMHPIGLYSKSNTNDRRFGNLQWRKSNRKWNIVMKGLSIIHWCFQFKLLDQLNDFRP